MPPQTMRPHVAPAALLALGLAVALPSPAAATPCPSGSFNGLSVKHCLVTQGTTELVVVARSDPQGVLFLNLSVGGTLQLIEEFAVYDKGIGDFPNFALTSATYNTTTRQIIVDLSESDSGFDLLSIRVVFDLSVAGDASQVTETVSMVSTAPEPIDGRLYVLSDFDLKGTRNDDTASANFTTMKVTFTDADAVSTGVFERIIGQAPNAFQVSLCCDLAINLASDIFFTPTGFVAPGPGDLQAVHSWDKNIPAFGTFTTTILKTVTLPEPSAALLQTAVLAALAGVARLRRRRRQS